MKAKSLRILRICALIYGWLLVIDFTMREGYKSFYLFQYYRRMKGDSDLEYLHTFPLDIMKSFESFFSALANAFLAFLVAAVFRMIEKQAPVRNETAKRLMIVCFLSYMASAICDVSSFINKLRNEPGYWQWPNFKGFDWLFFIPFTSSPFISLFIPVLYAVTIFVLFTHFTRMVTFESEVA
jgi:hypothetical protein